MQTRYSFFFVTFLLFSFCFGQQLDTASTKIHIEGQIVGAENKNIILANQSMGGANFPVAKVLADKKGKFVIDTNIAFDDYYFLGVEEGQFLNLVLRRGDEITVYGDLKNLAMLSNIIGSEDSELLNEFIVEFSQFKFQEDSLKNALQQNPADAAQVNAYFKPIAEHFYAYRNNFINSHKDSPALVATLNSINQEREWNTYKTVVDLLYRSFEVSPTVVNINKYVIKREAQMRQQEATNAMFKPGTLAKEIELPDVNGKLVRLSDLKGKVVLIDFWASWCGPCRRENPNVVKAYNKYSKDGFDVFSVSLDKPGAKDRWLAAIEKDGLVWSNHVSDLKGWKSSAAIDYAVKSIPFTVLIDTEGKIIGTNIRGERLAAELTKIFGY